MGDTEAVNITVVPNVEGFGVAVKLTLVGVGFTTCVIGGEEVLPSYSEEPLYVAVMECDPGASADVL
jgi:hypothetical protein